MLPLMTIEEIGRRRTICVHCQVKKNTNYSSNSEIIHRIEALEEKYKNDDDALEQIERSKTDIEYLEKMALEGNYKGQTPIQYIKSLEEHLSLWN